MLLYNIQEKNLIAHSEWCVWNLQKKQNKPIDKDTTSSDHNICSGENKSLFVSLTVTCDYTHMGVELKADSESVVDGKIDPSKQMKS